MRAFQVFLNGKRLCVAGIGDDGVLNVIVDWIAGNGHADLFLRVGGLISPTEEFVTWRKRNLRLGDEVRVKIVEQKSVDNPRKRYRIDPAQRLRSEKKYVRQIAKRLGWKVLPRGPKTRSLRSH